MPAARSPGLLGLPDDIVHHACSYMDKEDLAALSSTCSGLREKTIPLLFRELRFSRFRRDCKVSQFFENNTDTWSHVRMVFFQMAPFQDIYSQKDAYQRLRETSNGCTMLLRCCTSLQRIVVDFDLRGLGNVDEPEAQSAWKSVSAICDVTQGIGLADTTVAVKFDLNGVSWQNLEEWSANTWSRLFERIVGPQRLTEVAIVDTNDDDDPTSSPSSLAHLPIDVLRHLSLTVHPNRALALDASANLTYLHLELGSETRPVKIFKILERFKFTLVDVALGCAGRDLNGLYNTWKSAAPYPSFEFPKLETLKWVMYSDMAVIAKFFETVHVLQQCKLAISARCDKSTTGHHTADAPDMEAVRLASAIKRAGSHAIVRVDYIPRSSSSARMGQLAQLAQSFVGTRSELHLTIHDRAYHEEGAVRPAIELLHGLVEHGLSHSVHSMNLGIGDYLLGDSYRSANFATMLHFDKVREVVLRMGKRYGKESAFHLHFLLDRLDLPGVRELALEFVNMYGHEGCSQVFDAVKNHLPRWPALRVLGVSSWHTYQTRCEGGDALRELLEACHKRGIEVP